MERSSQASEEKATPGGAGRLIRQIRSKTRQRNSAEDKIRIVLEGFRKEIAVSDLCRREGISTAIYYSWLKDFMEAGKARLKGDTLRGATEAEVKRLCKEDTRLKGLVGEQALRIKLLKKVSIYRARLAQGYGSDQEAGCDIER